MRLTNTASSPFNKSGTRTRYFFSLLTAFKRWDEFRLCRFSALLLVVVFKYRAVGEWTSCFVPLRFHLSFIKLPQLLSSFRGSSASDPSHVGFKTKLLFQVLLQTLQAKRQCLRTRFTGLWTRRPSLAPRALTQISPDTETQGTSKNTQLLPGRLQVDGGFDLMRDENRVDAALNELWPNLQYWQPITPPARQTAKHGTIRLPWQMTAAHKQVGNNGRPSMGALVGSLFRT